MPASRGDDRAPRKGELTSRGDDRTRRDDGGAPRQGALPARPTGGVADAPETKLADVLRPRLAFEYEYDFGSTTQLALRVVAELQHMPRGKAIQLLALNDAPSYPCEVCGEPAQVVDRDGDQLLCKACAKDHADEDMVLPLVNSPRSGVCGYVGPVIQLPKRQDPSARRGALRA